MEDVALIDDLNDDLLYPIPSLLSDSSTRTADDRICEPPVTVQSSIQNNAMPFSRQRLHDNVLTVSDHLRTWVSQQQDSTISYRRIDDSVIFHSEENVMAGWYYRRRYQIIIVILLIAIVSICGFVFVRRTHLMVLINLTTLSVSIRAPIPCSVYSDHPPIDLLMTNISSLARDLSNCRYSSTDLVRWYLARIDAVNRQGSFPLHAVIETNPDALTIAESLDRERQITGRRSPIHGIPILIKDSITTDDQMQTTAGSFALIGARLGRDAHVVQQLRQAGAVILGKASLTEWSDMRLDEVSGSGWSARGGLARSAYVANGDPLGSSSGSAIAVSAGLCAGALGEETAGSIVAPASVASIVGLKPTVGLVSRSGVIPISRYHDSVGPMCQTVEDVALMLEIIQGIDELDNFTQKDGFVRSKNYTQFLRGIDGLQDLRLGVVRFGTNMSDEVNSVMNHTIELMCIHKAIIIDQVNITGINQSEMSNDVLFLFRSIFREDIDNYLRQLTNTSIRSLIDLIEFNRNHADEEFHPQFAPNQGYFEKIANESKLSLVDQQNLLNRTRQWGGESGIDATLRQHHLDALIMADFNDIFIMMASAVGYPLISVPLSYRQQDGQPYGLIIAGTSWSEPTLLRVAHGFEQASQVRQQRRPLYADN